MPVQKQALDNAEPEAGLAMPVQEQALDSAGPDVGTIDNAGSKADTRQCRTRSRDCRARSGWCIS